MRRLVGSILAAGVVFGAPALAGEEKTSADTRETLEQACLKMACQRDLQVSMRHKDGTAYQHTFKLYPPTVQGFSVYVVAGQTIYIEAEVEGNRLTKLRAVDKITAPEKTISAKLEQVDGKGMHLILANPFSKTLKFNMGMMPLDSERLVKTSSCPISPGKTNYESWPFPIFQIVLGNARLLEAGADLACVN